MSYNYHCSCEEKRNSCEFCDSKGKLVLQEKDEYACPSDSKTQLKLMGENTIFTIGSFSKNHIKGRSEKEKKERRINHFKKEILPTYSKKEQSLFKNRPGYKSDK